MITLLRRSIYCVPVLTALCAPAFAAPTANTNDLTGQDADGAANRTSALPDPSSLPEAQGNSKTVRMLLELQNAPPPLEGTGNAGRFDRNRADKERQAAARTAQRVNDGPANPANDATPAPQVDWRSGLPGRTVNAARTSETTTTVIGREPAPTAQRSQRSSPDDEVDVKAMLPNQVVNFLRQNREWVLLGSLGLLGLVWLGASAVSQRRV